jgi:hypothetical protein
MAADLNKPVIYPSDFIELVKSEYPAHEVLSILLEDNDPRVGNILEENVRMAWEALTPNIIWRAVEGDEEALATVKEVSALTMRRQKLCEAWDQIYSSY